MSDLIAFLSPYFSEIQAYMNSKTPIFINPSEFPTYGMLQPRFLALVMEWYIVLVTCAWAFLFSIFLLSCCFTPLALLSMFGLVMSFKLMGIFSPVVCYWEFVAWSFGGSVIMVVLHSILAYVCEATPYLQESTMLSDVCKIGTVSMSIVHLRSPSMALLLTVLGLLFLAYTTFSCLMSMFALGPSMPRWHRYAFVMNGDLPKTEYWDYFHLPVSNIYDLIGRMLFGLLVGLSNPYRILFYLIVILIIILFIAWYFLPKYNAVFWNMEVQNVILTILAAALPCLMLSPKLMLPFICVYMLSIMDLLKFMFFNFDPLWEIPDASQNFFSMLKLASLVLSLLIIGILIHMAPYYLDEFFMFATFWFHC